LLFFSAVLLEQKIKQQFGFFGPVFRRLMLDLSNGLGEFFQLIFKGMAIDAAF